MNIILCLDKNRIKVNNYEGFKNKALLVIPSDQDLTFNEILSLLESNDLSEMIFYNVEEKIIETDKNVPPVDAKKEYTDVEHGRLVGYSKLITFNNNIESGLITFNFQKINEEQEQITNMEMALVDLYESVGGNL